MNTLTELHARAWKFTKEGEHRPDQALESAAVEMISESQSCARDVIITLYRKTRDKASNGAWADELCADFGFDKDVVRAEAYADARKVAQEDKSQ